MIVLDTHVLSEVLQPTPDRGVINWLGTLPPTSVFTTSVTQAELLYVARLLPQGKLRSALLKALALIFSDDFQGRVLDFDYKSAEAFSIIAADRKNIGNPISQFDAMIAAIARNHGASLATRNAKDFVDCGITIINPWEF